MTQRTTGPISPVRPSSDSLGSVVFEGKLDAEELKRIFKEKGGAFSRY